MSQRKRKKAKELLRKYRARAIAAEPKWMLDEYQALHDYVMGTLDDNQRAYVESDLIPGLSLPDSHVNKDSFFGDTLIQDTYKVGTTSWIFMGRNLRSSKILVRGDLLAIGRTIDEPTTLAMNQLGIYPATPTLWAVFSRSIPPWQRAIGPCESLDEAASYIPMEFPEAMREELQNN